MTRWAISVAVLLAITCTNAPAQDPGVLANRYLRDTGEVRRISQSVAGQPAGASVPLFVIDGPGVIRYLSLQFGASPPELTRGAVLEFRWENSKDPGIRVPLGDFFGLLRGRITPVSTAFTNVRQAAGQCILECYIPMPFGSRARADLYNESPVSLPEFQLTVDYSPITTDLGERLFALWSLSRPVARSERHHAVKIQGAGLFVGGFIDLLPQQPGEWREAASEILVDGTPARELEYRSLTGWAGQPWGIAPELNTDRAGALPAAEGGALFYRFNLETPLRFNQSLAMNILPLGRLAGPRKDEVASICYGYIQGGIMADPLPPYITRLPRGIPVSIAADFIEAETLPLHAVSPGDSFGVIATTPQDIPYSGGKAWFGDFDAIGDFAELKYSVARSGNYHLIALIQRGPQMGDFRVLSDGNVINSLFSCHALNAPIPDIVRLGEAFIEEGTHTLRFSVAGKSPLSTHYGLALDAIQLAIAEREYVRKWLLIGPFRIPPPADGANDLGPEYAKAWAPEIKIDVNNPCDTGDGGQAVWNWYAPGSSGYVDFYNDHWKAVNCVAYALTHVKSPDDRDATLYFGSDDGATIWVNSKRVFDKPIQRAMEVDGDEIGIELRKGWNSILVKVGNAGGGWGFAMRLPAPEGTYEFSPYPP